MSIEPPHLVLHYLQVILLKLMFLSNILIRIRFLFIPLDHNIQLFRTTKYTTIIIHIVLFLATEWSLHQVKFWDRNEITSTSMNKDRHCLKQFCSINWHISDYRVGYKLIWYMFHIHNLFLTWCVCKKTRHWPKTLYETKNTFYIHPI